jgi:hypothetical protein
LVPSPLTLMTKCFFLQLNPCNHGAYVTFLTEGWVCPLWIIFAFVKCTYHTHSMLLKILAFCTICKSYASPGLAKQIMPILLILSYDGR